MPLSKETTDQIRKEAKDYAKIVVKGPTQWDDENTPKKIGYIAGAEVWAQKADDYRSALEEISKLELHDNLLSRDLLYNCIGIATKALEQFK